MSRTAPAALIAICFVSASGCGSSAPQNNQIAKEGAERNALLEAAKEHPGLHGDNAAEGKPLPPLPGVDIPAPKSKSSDHEMTEHNHH